MARMDIFPEEWFVTRPVGMEPRGGGGELRYVKRMKTTKL